MAVYRTRGCVPNDTIMMDGSRMLTCGRLNVHESHHQPSDHLLLGNDRGSVAAYDLRGRLSHPIYRTPAPVWSLDVTYGIHHHVAITAMSSCHTSQLLCAGTSMGQLDMFDGALRSPRVEGSISNAHSGSIVALDMYGHYIVTCGVSARSINPYDKNAPVKVV